MYLSLILLTCICICMYNLWQVGVSFTSKRYSKGNNKYLKAYDSKQESKKVIYLDTNNLYG